MGHHAVNPVHRTDRSWVIIRLTDSIQVFSVDRAEHLLCAVIHLGEVNLSKIDQGSESCSSGSPGGYAINNKTIA